MQRNNKGQFLKGIIPWNKDKKGIHLSLDTEFKKGNLPANFKGGIQNHIKWGLVFYDMETKKRTSYAKWILEQNGIIVPTGCVVYHLDGDTYNNNLDNLVVITRAELATLNRWG